ncbi:MAG: AMP-binding protein, partial [Desulfobacterota bacterium]|nr:AMP-binding protein [Thermodesulfobacteriota bacterium]
DRNANRFAHYFLGLGARPGDGVAVLMNNSPQFLDVFFGIQKIGMYINTVNTALKGDGLGFIIDNSDTTYLVVDYDLLDLYRSVSDRTPQVKTVIVNTLEAPEGPKGVVARYNKNVVDRLRPLAGLVLKPESVYFNALPLFHGNALFVTTTQALIAGCTMALSKRFSASRFWDEIWRSGATFFNTIGAIIPILMKTPQSLHEKDHKVTHVFSAGCPAQLWEPFEKRYGVTIWEAYAAIDGSGFIANFGDGPKGSIGKSVLSVVRIVDEHGNDVPPGTTGELLFQVPADRKSTVEYYKNLKATGEKTRGDWEYTGDLVYQDENGFLYFVGRSTDSMRRRGENVSAFDVEQAILKHPAVVEAAVYAVPSEMTEDEIMASVKLVDGENLSPQGIRGFLQDKLAGFAIPRYIRIVSDFPRTETFRIKKNELKNLGVTPDTFDAERTV